MPGREHTLGKGWGLNYGITYTTALDHSYQRYYDPETDNLLPDNNMNSRRREQTLNVYAGLSKSFGEKLCRCFSGSRAISYKYLE